MRHAGRGYTDSARHPAKRLKVKPGPCEVLFCTREIPWRRGNPAKRCPDHINSRKCRICGGEASRPPGRTGGPLPFYCSPECAYQAKRRQVTPEQRERAAAKSRAMFLDDIPCRDCGNGIPPRLDGIRRRTRCDSCYPIHDELRKSRKDRDKKFRQYGITARHYDEMLAAQAGGCHFCGRTKAHPTIDPYDFNVDHDHSCCPGKRSCGKCVRWLLCVRCNLGVGYFGDDPVVLRTAADKLENRHAALAAVA